jgi:hypothetical protein
VRLGQLNLALDVNVAFDGGAKEAPSLIGEGFGTVLPVGGSRPAIRRGPSTRRARPSAAPREVD